MNEDINIGAAWVPNQPHQGHTMNVGHVPPTLSLLGGLGREQLGIDHKFILKSNYIKLYLRSKS